MKTDFVTSINTTIQLRSIFYSLLSVIVAFGVFSWQTLWPLYKQTMELEEQYQNLLSEKQSYPKQITTIIDASVESQPKALLNIVAGIANRCHINIQSSVYATDHQVDHLNLVVTGSFNALRHFFQQLLMNGQVWLSGFQMVFDPRQQFSVKLKLRNAQKRQPSTHLQTNLASGMPFCSANLLVQGQPIKQNYAIEDMAMVGYIDFSDEPSALVRLPNMQVITVKKGDRLGKQKAIITTLQPHQLIAAHHQKIFNLSIND